MDETELRAALSRVTTTEPPLALDVEQVVAGGRARRSRRRLLTGTAAALLAAAAVAVPAVLWSAGGTVPAAGPRGVPYVTPTPGAPHGGCSGQTHSGSTQAHVFAQWFVQQLPATYRYRTDPGWQNSYQVDCADGARRDAVDVAARVVGTDGDIELTTRRNAPPVPVTRPCTQDNGVTTDPRSAEGTGTGTGAAPVPPAGVPRQVFDRCETRHRPDGSTVTIEESHFTGTDPLRSRTVAWWRADGTTVTLHEDNRHVLNDSTRNPRLVLTIDQMVALVTGPEVLVYLPPAR